MITIFGKPNCPQCIVAIKLLRAHEMKYEYKSLGTDYDDDELGDIIKSTNHRAFPFVFDEEHFVGDAIKLNAYLKGK